MDTTDAPTDDSWEASRLHCLWSIASRAAADAGLRCTEDIETLTITAYVALLNEEPTRWEAWQTRLITRLRRELVVWAWEEGQEGGSLPFLAPQRRPSSTLNGAKQ